MIRKFCDRCNKETDDLKQIGDWWGDKLYGKYFCQKCFDEGEKLGQTVFDIAYEKKEKVLKEFFNEKMDTR